MADLVLSVVVTGVLAGVAFGMIRSILDIWVRHRNLLAFFKLCEHHPELLAQRDQLSNLQPAITQRFVDWRLVGIALASIGVITGWLGRTSGSGLLAVGAYVGGGICVWLGVVIGFVGLLLHRASASE